MTTKKESEMLNGHSQTGELINSDSQEAKGSKMAEINPEEAPRETGETILADYAGSNGFNRLDMIPMDNLIHLCRLTMEQLNNEMENQISKAIQQDDKEQGAWLKEKAHLLHCLAKGLEASKPTIWDVLDFMTNMDKKAKENAGKKWFRKWNAHRE